MINQRAWTIVAIGAVLAVGSPAAIRAQTPPKPDPAADLLDVVPASAWGALVVRNLADFDRQILQLSQQLKLPTVLSPLAIATVQSGLNQGFDVDGPVALVAMPAAKLDQLGQNLALLIPTTDYAKLVAQLRPPPPPSDLSILPAATATGGDPIQSVLFRGYPSFVAPKGRFAVLGSSREAVQQVIDSKTGAATSWPPLVRQRWGHDDLALWINLNATGSMIAERLQIPQRTDPSEQEKRLFDCQNLYVAARLLPETVVVEAYLDGLPQISRKAHLAEQWAGLGFPGLPAEPPAIVASYQLVDGESRAVATLLDRFYRQTAESSPLAARIAETVEVLIKENFYHVVAISPTTNEEAGLAAVTLVAFGGGYESLQEQFRKLGPSQTQAANQPADQNQRPDQPIRYVVNAEGPDVHQLIIQPERIPISPETRSWLGRLFGNNNELIIRLSEAPHSGGKFVITGGGSLARHQQTIALLEKDQSPLDQHPAVHVLWNKLPANRYAQALIFPEPFFRLLDRLEASPLAQPAANLCGTGEPLAVYLHRVGTNEVQLGVRAPKDLLTGLVQRWSKPASAAGPAEPPGESQPPAEPPAE